VACWLVWQRYGTLELLRPAHPGAAARADIWLLGVVGFGLLAGIIPLHGWVPQARQCQRAAALFSTVVMKVGLLGILTLSLLGGNAAVVGRYAAGAGHDHRICRRSVCADGTQYPAPAGVPHAGKHRHYSAGAGRWRDRAESTGADCAGFIGGLYHLINHSLFKSTLFLGAGSVWFRTGHRDIEKLGGIGKKMPVISLAMLVGLMAMAALPPLNGFAGEWVIYQSFFKLATATRLSAVLGRCWRLAWRLPARWR
jgi:formate hydrogenlyase subunit 3